MLQVLSACSNAEDACKHSNADNAGKYIHAGNAGWCTKSENTHKHTINAFVCFVKYNAGSAGKPAVWVKSTLIMLEVYTSNV